MCSLPAEGYRTVGIKTQIPWPTEERIIYFLGHKFHLLPGSDELARMVRVETSEGFNQVDADKLILELLSSLAWAEQANAVTTFGTWCTRPLDVGNGPIGTMVDGQLDYLPDPPDPKAKLALALYREGLSVNLVPYQFLGFFKVINIFQKTGSYQKKWIGNNLQHVADTKAIARVATIRRFESDVADYLYKSGRCAVAHAFDQTNVVNPDDPADLIRLSEDLPVIRELARVAIEREFGVKSKRDFHSEHLQGFRTQFGDALVSRIKSRELVPPTDVPIPTTLALRLRDRDHVELFEAMNATVEEVRDRCVRIRLDTLCQRLSVFIMLDFGQESLVSDPLTDVESYDDGTPEAAKAMLQWAHLHKSWFGGNGVIELWDIGTGKQMARSQPYLGPVNARFSHDEFAKMESVLRERVAASPSA